MGHSRKAPASRSAKGKARCEAEALFARLRGGTRGHFPSGVVIRVFYTSCFAEGKCSIVMVIPITIETLLRKINCVARDNPGCYVSRNCLVLSGTYPDFVPGDERPALERARQLARQAEEGFGLQAIVSPAQSLRQLLPRL